jgi:hypothetical protein
VAAVGLAGCAEVAKFVGCVAGFADDEAAGAAEPAITGDEAAAAAGLAAAAAGLAAAAAGLAAAAGAADAPPAEPTASTAAPCKALPDRVQGRTNGGIVLAVGRRGGRDRRRGAAPANRLNGAGGVRNGLPDRRPP